MGCGALTRGASGDGRGRGLVSRHKTVLLPPTEHRACSLGLAQFSHPAGMRHAPRPMRNGHKTTLYIPLNLPLGRWGWGG